MKATLPVLTMQTGDVIGDRFELEQPAGAGGMGAVFRARDRVTGEIVALKMLHSPTPEHAERFAREARALAQLSHPGIVRYVAHGGTANGLAYIAMEWLEGEDLAKRLVRAPLTLAESVRLGAAVADALTAAHARGVIHRDLKPANLFLVGGSVDRVKVLDFGVARLRDSPRATTGTGAVVGTPGFIAPEQARGAREIDARADLFALGCVLFTCITGKPAFSGESVVAVLAKILFEQGPRVRDLRSDVPPALDEIVARLMAKDRALRPKSAEEVARALVAVPLDSPGAPPPAAGSRTSLTGGERRLLSVILAGDPEKMVGEWPAAGALYTLSAHESVPDPIRALVERHGGELELLPNGVLIASLAGGTTATDQAAQGARCALAMRAISSEMSIVLATGRVGPSAGRVPIGEVIDRAVSLLRAVATSPEGSRGARAIRIDRVTSGLLDARFEVHDDEAGPYLVGERLPLLETRKLLGKSSPCVGRERELGLLRGIFDECVTEPVARAVLVVGSPGVGKTRLCHEFLARVRDRGMDVWIGLGDAMSSGSPFGMVAQALRRTAGLLDGEPLEARHQKLRTRVARHVSADDVPRVTQFLGELVGAPVPEVEPVDAISAIHAMQLRAARRDPRLMGDQMCRAWEDFVAAECAARPVLLVLEDLHWGDLPSVKLVDAALRAAHDRSFMVLAFARHEVHDVFPRLWSGRGVVEIELGELSKKASERLVRHALGNEVPADTVERIVSRGGGNAFYLEELIRAEAEGKGDAPPETVLASLERRLEGLEPEARRILRAASIFGDVFSLGGVVELVGASSAEKIAEWLEELVERELLVRRTEARFPGEVEYVFRHALVREAAYAMLTDEDRTLGHKLAGSWLEQMGERDAVVLAEHFERGGELRRALDEYRRAAEDALEGNDFMAVIVRAERAIACGASGALRGVLRWMQAEAHAWHGDLANAEASALEALEHLPRGTAAWFSAAAELVRAAMRLGHRERALTWVDALCEQDMEPDAVEARSIALARAATALRLDLDRAHLLLEASSRLANVTGKSPLAEAWRSHVRAWLSLLRNEDVCAFLKCSETSLAYSELVGDVRNATSRRYDIGYGYLLLGAFEEAEHVLRDCLATAERMGMGYVAAVAQHNLGLVLATRGAFEEAIRVERSALGTFVAQGDRRFSLACRTYLARILLEAGELDDAEAEATAAAHGEGAADLSMYAGAVLARVHLTRGDTARAFAQLQQTLAQASRVTLAYEGEAYLHLVQAEILHATGDVAEAKRVIDRAARRLHERAAKLEEPKYRATFLEQVPENARILSLARAWGASAACSGER